MRSALAAAAVGFTLAVLPAMAQTSASALTYSQPVPQAGVLAVQQRLQQQGAYSGRSDGIWGPDSQAALEHYQQTHGLQVTGQLNQATLATLGLPAGQVLTSTPTQAATATAPGPAPVVGNSLSRSSVRTVQLRLQGLNFYHGAIDGIWGGSTAEAIEKFQRSRGLQADGQLNPATITGLGLDPNAMVQGR